MTGQWPDRHDVVQNARPGGGNLRLADKTPTLAEALKGGGYATYGVVSNPNAAALYGYGRGFDRYDELFKDPALFKEGVDPARTRERAEALLDAHAAGGGGPLFLYVHFFQPHAPYAPPPEFLPRTARDYEGPARGTRAFLDGIKERGEPDLTPEDRAHLRTLYGGNLAWADREAAALIEGLKARGLADDAVVVICSDHGEAFGEHGDWEHGHHLYEEGLRIPLMIRFPGGLHAGLRLSDPVCLTDLAPTLTAAAGLTAPKGLGRDGVDLMPAIEGGGGENDADRMLLARSDVFRPSWSLRWRGWYFIHDSLTRREELFRLDRDPRQQDDVLADHPVIAGWLRSRLCALLCELLAEEAGMEVELDAEFVESIQGLGYAGGKETHAKDRVRCPLWRGASKDG